MELGVTKRVVAPNFLVKNSGSGSQFLEHAGNAVIHLLV